MHHDIELSKKGEAYAPRHNPTGCPIGIEPHVWRKALSRRVETHLALATALLSLLDGLNGDCDLEDVGDLESSLGGIELYGEVDLEGGDDLEDEDDGTAEPSLGSTERTTIHILPFGWMGERNGYEQRFPSGQQIDWAGTGYLDLEVGEGDDEPDAEGEPSLGSPEIGAGGQYLVADGMSVIILQGSQERWANGLGDHEEEAINEDGDECEGAA